MTNESESESVNVACTVGDFLADLDEGCQLYAAHAEALAGKDDALALAAVQATRALVSYREAVRQKADKEGVRPVKLSGKYLNAATGRRLTELFPQVKPDALVEAGRLLFMLGGNEKQLLIALAAVLIQNRMM